MDRHGETRARVEMQGYHGLDDATLRRVEPWLRVAPALCMTWAALATGSGSAVLFAGLVPFAALGVVLPRHPFDALAHALGAPQVPRSCPPRRFACAVAAGWLASASAAFAAGQEVAGTVLGAGLVLAASVPVVSGFCVPSWVWTRVLRLPAACPRAARPVDVTGV